MLAARRARAVRTATAQAWTLDETVITNLPAATPPRRRESPMPRGAATARVDHDDGTRTCEAAGGGDLAG
jgi:hypothetical protein